MPTGRFHSDKSGNRYGMLTLVCRLNSRQANGSFKYLVQCDCGESKVVGFAQMTSGRTQSCGCLNKRKGTDSPNFKHGLSQNRETQEYKRYQRECFDRSRYGLEPQHKQALLDAQSNSCAICGYKFGQKVGDMKVDHDHATGDVRGLLCDHCNRGLGFFRDNQDNLKNAINYLAR
jgi:hypothetical protein